MCSAPPVPTAEGNGSGGGTAGCRRRGVLGIVEGTLKQQEGQEEQGGQQRRSYGVLAPGCGGIVEGMQQQEGRQGGARGPGGARVAAGAGGAGSAGRRVGLRGPPSHRRCDTGRHVLVGALVGCCVGRLHRRGVVQGYGGAVGQ